MQLSIEFLNKKYNSVQCTSAVEQNGGVRPPVKPKPTITFKWIQAEVS